MITKKAYAKINLTLNILNKRDDGYHNLKSIVLPIDFYDVLTFKKSDNYNLISNFKVNVEHNIITKAFNLMKKLYKIPNCEITLDKKIPTLAGLGGGSADATATIHALNELFELNLSIHELEHLANSLGSDTLFTLHNKPAVITSRGDVIEFIENSTSFFVLLIKPDYGFSTKQMFSKPFESIKHNDELFEVLKQGDVSNIDKYCHNDFLKRAIDSNDDALNLYTYLSTLHKTHLSGSGSTFFMISQSEDELIKIQSKINKDYNIFTRVTKTLI